MDGSASGVAMVHVRSYAPSAEAHSHVFHQLVLPLVGSLDLEIGNRGGRVSGRTGALVPSGERHAFAATAKNEFLVLDLPLAAVAHADAAEWLDHLGHARFFPVSRAAARLASWFADEVSAVGAPPALVAAFVPLLLRAASMPVVRSVPHTVQRALAFIEENGLEEVCVSDVARAAGVSAGHLHALFRAYVGRTPGSLIATRRVEEARRLLAETELPIAEVALRCGFADQTSLTHAVRRELGTTPRGLRRPQS